jgi:uncharacterized Rmd1/YagE family protein
MRFDMQSILTGCILASCAWLFSAVISHSERLTALEARVDASMSAVESSVQRIETKLDKYVGALEYAKRELERGH